MAQDRIDELKKLLPQCMLPDWVRLGRRLIRILQDRQHPDQRDALLERLFERVHASIALREQRRINMPQGKGQARGLLRPGDGSSWQAIPPCPADRLP